MPGKSTLKSLSRHGRGRISDQVLSADQRLSEDEDGDGDDGGIPVRLNDAGLRDVPGADDLSADLEDLLFFVPALVDIEIDAEGRGQHGGGQILRIIPRLALGLAEGVVFADVAVGPLVGGDGAPHGGGQQPPRLIAAAAAQNAIGDGAGVQLFEAPGPGNHLAAGRHDARYLDQVAFFDAGVPERQFEGMELLLVDSHPLGEKHLLGYIDRQWLLLLQPAAARTGRSLFFAPAGGYFVTGTISRAADK